MISVITTRSAVLSLGLVAATAAAACHGAPPTARERVLAGLPADTVAVVAADGRALAHPRIRRVLDVIAARWPATLGCLVDAAVASDAVGASVDRASNITVILVLRAAPRCAALSQRAPGLWIATVGAGPSASTTSVSDDPRFARARPYLETSPVAAVVLGDVHLVAAAQPEPFEAWAAIDAPRATDAMARAMDELIARLRGEPSTAAVAAKLRTERPGASQLVVRLDGSFDGELADTVRTVFAWADAAAAPGAPPASAAFACPAPAAGITCENGTSYRVSSLAAGLSPILDIGRPAPIVINGNITGLRLEAPVPDLGLQAGDVVVAMAGRLVTSRAMLADWIARARGGTAVTIRRGATETVLQFAER